MSATCGGRVYKHLQNFSPNVDESGPSKGWNLAHTNSATVTKKRKFEFDCLLALRRLMVLIEQWRFVDRQQASSLEEEVRGGVVID